MNVVDLISGESCDFTLTEWPEAILKTVQKLSSSGANLLFTMSQEEKGRFEELFQHAFHVRLREYVEADDSLTYREGDDDGKYTFTTYVKPD